MADYRKVVEIEQLLADEMRAQGVEVWMSAGTWWYGSFFYQSEEGDWDYTDAYNLSELASRIADRLPELAR